MIKKIIYSAIFIPSSWFLNWHLIHWINPDYPEWNIVVMGIVIGMCNMGLLNSLEEK